PPSAAPRDSACRRQQATERSAGQRPRPQFVASWVAPRVWRCLELADQTPQTSKVSKDFGSLVRELLNSPGFGVRAASGCSATLFARFSFRYIERFDDLFDLAKIGVRLRHDDAVGNRLRNNLGTYSEPCQYSRDITGKDMVEQDAAGVVQFSPLGQRILGLLARRRLDLHIHRPHHVAALL